MANRYYDYNNGSSGNDGSTPLLAKATRSQAVSASSAGDEVIAVDGIQVHESGHFTFDDDRIENAESFRGATLEANAAETVRVARTSGSLQAANNPFLVKDLVFNGQSGSGGEVNQGFDVAQDAAEDIVVQMHNCYFIAGSLYGLLINQRRGRVELVNARITMTAGAVRHIASTSSLAGDGNQAIDIQGVILDGTATTNSIGINLTKINNLSNTFTVALKNVTGSVDISSGAAFSAIDINGCDAPLVTGFDFSLSNDFGDNIIGVLCRGQSTATATNVTISAGTVEFLCAAGFGIALGQSTVASNVIGGTVTGCTVTGKFYASNSPHCFVVGQAVTGEIVGCTAQDGYVGFLISKTTDGTVKGNLTFDCYGPNYYVKGTTDCTVTDNIAVVSNKHVQRDRGILAVAPQGATNTAAATIQENLVIVTDISNIHSLAYIEDASQVCAFIRNTYIIPDTVDVSSASLFSYENGAGGAANNTLAQWNAQSEVTDDVIVQMPLSEINTLVNSLRPVSGGGGGGGLGLGLG